MLRTTHAAYIVLATSFEQYKQALRATDNDSLKLRLLVSMVNLVGSFNLPTDVLDEFDKRIGDAYDRITNGKSYMRHAPKVIYTAFSGSPVVDRLQYSLAYAF